MIRRVTFAAALFACALLVPGCGAEVPKETDNAFVERDSVVSGGWRYNSDQPVSLLTEEQSTLVADALGDEPDDLGRTLSPVSILAQTFFDNGAPDRIGLLAQAREGDEITWSVVTIDYDDTGNNVRPMKYTEDIDPTNLGTTDTWEGAFADAGWQVVGTSSSATLGPDAQAAFDQVRPELEAKAQGEVRVHALIATQLVSGTNYLYLVESRPDGDIESRFSFVIVYQDLQGGYEVTENSYVDLMAYLEW